MSPHNCLSQDGACGAVLDDTGVVAVEFALTAPLMLLIMVATMAFALHFCVLAAVIHASNEGARASIGGIGDADRAAAATARVNAVFKSYGPLLSWSRMTATPGPGASQGTYQVKVVYDPGVLDVVGFYRFWHAIDGKDHGGEQGISYTATVSNGGY